MTRDPSVVRVVSQRNVIEPRLGTPILPLSTHGLVEFGRVNPAYKPIYNPNISPIIYIQTL